VADSRTTRNAKSKTRLEAFSDGVFAIAITLLVIEIAVPVAENGHLLSALLHERTVYIGYFIAFMSIGVVWIEHSALTEALERVDAGFLRLNLLLLLLVAFLPYPARVMEEYLSLTDAEAGGERTAVAFFGLVLILMSLMLIVLGRYAEREGLFGGDAAEERQEDNRLRYQLAPALIAYCVAAGLGLVQPYIGVTLYFLIGVYLLLPVRTVRRLLGRGDGDARGGDSTPDGSD
jgi:uncharacterized membrane protein